MKATRRRRVVVLLHPADPGQGESVTIMLDIRSMNLPQKQGRWGQWRGVTFLSNWLPVFAYYGDAPDPRPGDEDKPRPAGALWQPTPFVPWHQPFFNEAGIYHVRVDRCPPTRTSPAPGTVIARHGLRATAGANSTSRPTASAISPSCAAPNTRSSRGDVQPGPGTPRPIRIHILAFPEHEYYAREMLRIAAEALTTYGKWFGPYPYPDFTIVESYFGWNGNECGDLVMIDERIFGMPHLAGGFVDYLVSHEICHQWWYNVVGTNGYGETWMDEGLATYFSPPPAEPEGRQEQQPC